MQKLILLILAALLITALLPAPARKNTSLKSQIYKIAALHDLNPKLLTAIVAQESSFNSQARKYEPKLKSSSLGLMQIIPKYYLNSKVCPDITAESDLLNPILNLDCGARILKGHITRYGAVKPALIAYNGGENCFKSASCITQGTIYAEKVLARTKKG